jgi:hypothetical protein
MNEKLMILQSCLEADGVKSEFSGDSLIVTFEYKDRWETDWVETYIAVCEPEFDDHGKGIGDNLIKVFDSEEELITKTDSPVDACIWILKDYEIRWSE